MPETPSTTPIGSGNSLRSSPDDTEPLQNILTPTNSSQLRQTPSQSQADIIKFPAHPNTILSVTAGPGSGKTYTIACRIAELIQNGMDPSEVLVLSMANRSVHSLRESLTTSLGSDTASQIHLSTFHLFSAKIIDTHAETYIPLLGRRKLVDEVSWKHAASLFSGGYVKLDGTSASKINPQQFEELVSQVRSGKLCVEEAAKKYNVNQRYVESLVGYLDLSGVIRFNDLVSNAMKIIEKSLQGPYISQLEKYKVVVVDEFQDIYESLLKMVEMITTYPTEGVLDKSKHLFVAGDPNQSIYGFLGSKPQMLLELESHLSFAEIHHAVIKESFRCTPEVLKVASQVCKSELQAVKTPLHPVVLRKFESPLEEYDFIISEIIRLCCELGGMLTPSDFAILARSNKEVEDISTIIDENYGLKYNKLTSSVSWLKSKVHILQSLLSVLERSNGSEISLLCILLFLDNEFGSKTRVSKLFLLARQWSRVEGIKGDVLEDYLVADSLNELSKDLSAKQVYKTVKHQRVLQKFHALMANIHQEREILGLNYLDQTPQMLLETLVRLIDKIGLKDYLNRPSGLKKSSTESEEESLQEKHSKQLSRDINSFYMNLELCYKRYTHDFQLGDTGDSFLRYFLRYYNEVFQITPPDLINTSTIHAAKGLEFPVVFVVGSSAYKNGPWDAILSGLETETSPYGSSNARLLYVAMTRSKMLLYQGSTGACKDVVITGFTSRLPDAETVIQRVSSELDRKIPSPARIAEGKTLLRSFYTQKRGFRTAAVFHRASRLLRI